SLQPQPVQRRDLARQVHLHRRGQSAAVRARLPEPEADEARERVLPLPGGGARAADRSAFRQRWLGVGNVSGARPRRGFGSSPEPQALIRTQDRAYAHAMARFLVKTEPSTYSFAKLQR